MDWRHVRDEASALMDRAEELFQPHDPKLMVRGEMKYFVLRSKG